ncbi:uncharacterized protein DS421_19g670760 [Arachis hypogaea]|uniref:Uncharacterized protein n=1 Tax=Arachis hypogaea TaxID=3818 RepID=A0A6B9VD12_ARAHY|nr:uncharacterized protein DS421_19g670760 [Arachis hypogaea]
MFNIERADSEQSVLQREAERVRDGGSRFIEEDDSDAGGDGGSEGSPCIQGPVRTPPHPSQQVPPGRALPSMEVRERASLLREVPVRAPHGAHASDAEDQGTSLP